MCDFPKETAGRFLPSGCFEEKTQKNACGNPYWRSWSTLWGCWLACVSIACADCVTTLTLAYSIIGHIGVAGTAVRGLDILGFSKCCTIRSSEYQCFVRTSIVCANDTIICCIAGAAKQNIASFQLVSVTCLIQLNRDIAASHSRICCRSRIKRRLDRIRIQTASICGSTVTICVVESECSRPAEVRLFRGISRSRFSSTGSLLCLDGIAAIDINIGAAGEGQSICTVTCCKGNRRTGNRCCKFYIRTSIVLDGKGLAIERLRKLCIGHALGDVDGSDYHISDLDVDSTGRCS